jgi:hypothetical protein
LQRAVSFYQQATLAAMLGGLGIFVGATHTNCAVQHPHSNAILSAQTICDATVGNRASLVGNVLVLTLLGSPAALQSDPLEMCRHDNSALSASIFFTLYLGILTPLYVTYWYERRIKAAYLDHLCRTGRSRRLW